MLDVKRNLTTMTDFYELTMSAGYLDEGYVDKIAVFDMFFRRVPDGGGYAIMAGLQQRLEQLALNGRTLDGDDGLLREDGHALLNGPDIAAVHRRRGSPEIYRRGHRLSALHQGV